MISQFKRFISLLLVVIVLVSSLSVPAYAVDEVYSMSDDTAVLTAPIFYTPDYYPGAVAEMRGSGFFANRIAHGSYSALNYNPSYSYVQGGIKSGDFNTVVPLVTADQTDVSGIYQIPATTLLEGSGLFFKLPSTDDCYFDFQSSNFLFDQQSPQANTFYINGDLTFSLRNLWDFNGYIASGSAKTASWYLASDPLAVQLVIDGKAYGDIIDVTSYTSPFTALYNGGLPANATVSFNNLKVYYQGDTPDMIGFRVYTGSAFTSGSYTYGDFMTLEVTNTITFRCSEIPEITFLQEGGDGYAGDLSGISGLLSQILSGISGLRSLMVHPSGDSWLRYLYQSLTDQATTGKSWVNLIYDDVHRIYPLLMNPSGTSWLSVIRSLMVDSSGRSWIDMLYNSQMDPSNNVSWIYRVWSDLNPYFSTLYQRMDLLSGYLRETAYGWQSYNMENHELNAATDVTGTLGLMYTAFQSYEDKLGRLAYVFGSDEDLALKDSADPGTDAFRENFGGGLSLGQISDGADVVKGVDGLFDSGYDFGDAFTEIAGESMFTMWFSAENAAAIDSTGSVMVLDDSDPYHMQIYYDRLQEVAEKRDWGYD